MINDFYERIPSVSSAVSSSWHSCADSCEIATSHSKSDTGSDDTIMKRF